MDERKDSTSQVITSIGVDLEVKEGRRQPEYGVYSEIHISRGEHEFLIVTKEGKQLRKHLNVKTETYIGIDCMAMSISGGE
jgi:hypothetical protein